MTDELTMGLTANAVAKHLNCNVVTVRRWAKEGKLPYLSLGGRRMIFSRRVIDELLARGGKFQNNDKKTGEEVNGTNNWKR